MIYLFTRWPWYFILTPCKYLGQHLPLPQGQEVGVAAGVVVLPLLVTELQQGGPVLAWVEILIQLKVWKEVGRGLYIISKS